MPLQSHKPLKKFINADYIKNPQLLFGQPNNILRIVKAKHFYYIGHFCSLLKSKYAFMGLTNWTRNKFSEIP